MNEPDKLPPRAQELLDHGRKLNSEIQALLLSWPSKDNQSLDLEECEASHRESAEELSVHIARWFNTIGNEILPITLHDTQSIYYTMRRVQAAVKKKHYERPKQPKIPRTISIDDGATRSILSRFWEMSE